MSPTPRDREDAAADSAVRQASTDPASQTTEEAGRTTAEDPGSRTAAFLPVLGELTFDEIHAAYLGTMGVLVGISYAAGNVEEAIGFSLTAIGVAFGIRVLPEETHVPGASRHRETRRRADPNPAVAVLTFLPWVLDTAAARTIRREPLVFVAVYLVMFLTGTGLAAVLARTV